MAEKRGGRPMANIDWDEVDKFLQAQCEGTAIAGLLGINPETLYNRCKRDNKMGFSEYAALKKGEGKEILRMKQYQTALEGSVPMQIWLGKQYLDQKDKKEVDQNLKATGITLDLGGGNIEEIERED